MTLAEADPDLDCFSFLPGPRGTRFWARRQAHETAIHRVDAQSVHRAGSDIIATTPEFAADGIDELLYGFFARRPSRLATSNPYSFSLHPSDIDRTWVVRVGADGASTSDSGEGQIPLTATAFELYLMLWNRRPLPNTLSHWRDHALVQWAA